MLGDGAVAVLDDAVAILDQLRIAWYSDMPCNPADQAKPQNSAPSNSCNPKSASRHVDMPTMPYKYSAPCRLSARDASQ